MTAIESTGPFVSRRHKPAKGAHAWRKPGHEHRHAQSREAPASGPERSRGGVGLLGAFLIMLAVGATGAGALGTFGAVSEHRAAVAAEAARATVAASTAGGRLSAAEAAIIVANAPRAAFADCFARLDATGWPAAGTEDATRAARRVALAECLRGH